jgi:hypothetical protein
MSPRPKCVAREAKCLNQLVAKQQSPTVHYYADAKSSDNESDGEENVNKKARSSTSLG